MSSGILNTICPTGYVTPFNVTIASVNDPSTSELMSKVRLYISTHVAVNTIVCVFVPSIRTFQDALLYHGLSHEYEKFPSNVSKT